MRCFLLLVCFFAGYLCFAQRDGYLDSLVLEEVTVRDTYLERYSVGSKIQKLERKNIIVEGSSSLSDIIRDNTSIFINQYGAEGQLASINTRGLGASRTSLLWNGIEINSPTLGQADFNLVSSSVFNNIFIQFGSGASLFGNGAIGGAVNLENNLEGAEDDNVYVEQSAGSFSNYRSVAGFIKGRGNFKSSTQAYYQKAENDFPYSTGDQRVRQPNAAFETYGILQDLLYRFNSAHSLKFSGWYDHNFREIQPGVGNTGSEDNLEDNDWRTSLAWDFNTGKNSLSTQVGYFDYKNVFNESSSVHVKRTYFSSTFEQEVLANLSFRSGVNWNQFIADTDNFNEREVEHRNDVFVNALYKPASWLKLNVNFRQPFLNGEAQSFSPNFGVEYFIPLENQLISLRGQAGRSFRLPTLNDRYWNPGGNLDLNAETGRNYELGVNHRIEFGKTSLETDVNYFSHLVENWILWRPGGSGTDSEGNFISFWFPENLREVDAEGVELSVQLKGVRVNNEVNAGSSFNLTYSKVVNRLPLSPVDRSVGRQLPFTPLWNLNGTSYLNWKSWKLAVQYSFTSERFVEANNELRPLDGFALLNFSVARNFDLSNTNITTAFRLNNAFDTNYESYDNRAMPGINYEFTFRMDYKL